MPTNAVVSSTPQYVLLDKERRIGPDVDPAQAGFQCAPIYGFSDKGPYDAFCVNSPLKLRPYPLVKGYLRDQVAAPGQGLRLVVVDAAGPREPFLQATTMEAVLEAQESGTHCITTMYRLVFDQEADAYRMQEVPV